MWMTIKRHKQPFFPAVFMAALVVLEVAWGQTVAAMDLSENLSASFGGHVKLRGEISWPAKSSPYQLVGGGPYLDHSMESRLKGELQYKEWAAFETHYEMVSSGGDTREKTAALARRFPMTGLVKAFSSNVPDDGFRLMDLTAIISEAEDRILYHRLDRMALTLSPDWGVFRVGRQVVTWGNGMLFNPMDLFNPFAPTDVEREYKTGDDMVFVQTRGGRLGAFQLLYVPRRDPLSSHVSWDRSSMAAKSHLSVKMFEIDLMAACHYDDRILGIGGVGYVGSAAWRVDATWTLLDDKSPSDDYLSLVANMDYSWIWMEKNFYGFIEFYYSGIGEKQYDRVWTNPDIINRVLRGELFTLCRTYLAAGLTAELHPLVNLNLTSILNTQDPSGYVQPTLAYDICQDVRMIVGANLPWGSRGTEFGGIDIPMTDFTTRTPKSVFLWGTYYF